MQIPSALMPVNCLDFQGTRCLQDPLAVAGGGYSPVGVRRPGKGRGLFVGRLFPLGQVSLVVRSEALARRRKARSGRCLI